MEEQTNQINQQNFNKPDLKNHIAVLVLGIISIVMCWCYGIIGLVLGIISLALASKSEQLYKENPEAYSLSSYNNMKAGRICAIIGTSLSAVYVVFVIIYLLFIGTLMTSVPWQMGF